MYTELIALTYNGPVPHPHPACELPTPDEQFRQHVEERHRNIDAGEYEQQQKGSQPHPGAQSGGGAGASSAGGIFSKTASSLRSFTQQALLEVKRMGTEVTTMTETQVRQVGRHISKDRFASAFQDLAAMGEDLLGDYACIAMHGGQRVSGHMYVTKNYLCFNGHTTSTLAQATNAVRGALLGNNADGPVEIRQVIPLTEVVSIQLSVALDTVDNGPPFFLTIPAPNVLATSLQIYTSRQLLYQFLSFESLTSSASAVLSDSVKGRPIDRAYNYLDHAWRASTTVPVPGVKYY